MEYMKKKYFRPTSVVVHIPANNILAGSDGDIPINEDEHNNVSGDAKASGIGWFEN